MVGHELNDAAKYIIEEIGYPHEIDRYEDEYYLWYGWRNGGVKLGCFSNGDVWVKFVNSFSYTTSAECAVVDVQIRHYDDTEGLEEENNEQK